MKIFCSLVFFIAILSVTKAQNLDRQPALQQYTDTFVGQQVFAKYSVGIDNREEKITHYLQETFLKGLPYGIGFTKEYTRTSPGGEYITYQLIYDGKPVYGRLAKVMVDNAGVLRWAYHNVPSFTAPTQTVFLSGTEVVDFYWDNFPDYVIQMDGNQTWMADGQTLIPSFYLKLKDTVAYTIEKRVYSTQKRLLYVHKLYSNFQKTDTPAQASVFDPDPLTTANVFYGGAYSHNNGQETPELAAQRKIKPFDVKYTITGLVLEDDNFLIKEITAPYWPATIVNNGTMFNFVRNNHSFGDVNVFYHLTNYKKYVDSLGYKTLPGFKINVDAHAFDSAERSQFAGGDVPPSLQFGDGGVPDNEDADVVIHEFCHALAFGAAPNTSIGQQRWALDEGLADYFAASYSKSVDDFNWQKVFNWDGNVGGWQGRRVDYGKKYPEGLLNNVWKDGQFWSTAFMIIYDSIGREKADKLMLEALYRLAPNMSMRQLAYAVLQIDSIKNGGANSQAIQCAFGYNGILIPDSAAACHTFVGISEFGKPKKGNLCTIYNSVGFAMGGEVVINFEKEGNYTLTLMDSRGVSLYQKEEYTANNLALNSANIAPGVYFLIIKDKNGLQQTEKLVRY